MNVLAWKIVLGLIVIQWLGFLIVSFASRGEAASRIRATERNLMISTAVLALGWIALFGMTPGFATGGPVSETSATPGLKSRGSCASIEAGMSASTVRERLGESDETRDDAATRGPGAQILIYRDSRCAVHLLEGQVEFID
ncbi:MAG: hypothetical protein ABI837_11125 [Acidobacteriota bacterium]